MVLRCRAVGLLLLLLLPAAFGLAACGEEEVPTEDKSGESGELPDGRTFLSTSVTEVGAPRPLAEGTRIRVDFVDDDLRMEAGCNLLGFDNTRLDGDRLLVDQISFTEMGCPPDRLDQDDWLLDFMGSDPTMRLDGDTLQLTSEDVTIELLDIEVADPDRPLVGTRWRINTVLDGESANTYAEEAKAYLAFGADGTVTGRTACNSFSARYETNGPKLRVLGLEAGTSPCRGYASEIETAVFDVLSSDSTIDIETELLTLTTAGGVGVSWRSP